ncbi:hypothetical protein [Ferrovum sp.]|uniref:hypothetical protein n=1 Tax=Ferrovum sp. TaxID=2609467 RepID=UPI00262023E2|nr:hypothetical protein [Ferrovum sp.]
MNTAGVSHLLDDYQSLRRTLKCFELPDMCAATLKQQAHVYVSANAQWQMLAEHRPIQGWLQFQSYQCAFTDGLPQVKQEWGVLLRAEAVAAGAVSLNLNRRPAGDWVTVESQHIQGGEWLCDEVAHLAYRDDLGYLRYRRYWSMDRELGPVQVAACFIGFDQSDARGA